MQRIRINSLDISCQLTVLPKMTLEQRPKELLGMRCDLVKANPGWVLPQCGVLHNQRPGCLEGDMSWELPSN